jgi:multidrug transporter EmrE-like cation transporter
MKTPLESILCFVLASGLGAAGQFFYKSGASRANGGPASYLLNPRLLAGVACYMGVMVLFIAAFKRGGALSVLYPIYASTFIFSAIGAWLIYAEPLHPANFAGMALLIAGMFLLGWKPS